MQLHDINATHRNKKFVVSIMQALEQLKADEFINLFQQADNPDVYKLTKADNDAHTRLFREIALNSRVFPIGKEHGEIILQALYALPKVSNTNKMLAMLLVGATLEYDYFKSMFGEGGDFFPNRNSQSHFFDDLNDARVAFSAGLNQSDDVRFLIDKMRAIESVYPRHTESFVDLLRYFNFTPSSFAELCSASGMDKEMIIYNAPKELIHSSAIVDLMDNGFVPQIPDIEHSYFNIFKSGNVDTFIKFTKMILEKSSSIQGYDFIYRFFLRNLQLELTGAQLTIKNALVQELNSYELATADRNPFLFSDCAIQFMTRAFESGDLDQFSKLTKAANQTGEARKSFMPVFMEINDMVSRGLIITDDHKYMMNLLKDSVIDQMNNLIEHAQPTAPQKRDSRGRSRFDEYTGRGL